MTIDTTDSNNDTTTTDNKDSNNSTTQEELVGLDKFAGLFDNGKDDDKTGDNKDSTPTIFNPVDVLQDEEAVSALMGKIDFSSAITEDTQKLIQDKDPGAIIALSNDIGKASYLQAMQHMSAMMTKHIDGRLAQQDTNVNSQINSSINTRDLAGIIPELNTPIVALAVQPFIDKYRAANPKANAQDIATQVKSYLTELNSTVNPSTTTDPAAGDEQDMLEWLGLK